MTSTVLIAWVGHQLIMSKWRGSELIQWHPMVFAHLCLSPWFSTVVCDQSGWYSAYFDCACVSIDIENPNFYWPCFLWYWVRTGQLLHPWSKASGSGNEGIGIGPGANG